MRSRIDDILDWGRGLAKYIGIICGVPYAIMKAVEFFYPNTIPSLVKFWSPLGFFIVAIIVAIYYNQYVWKGSIELYEDTWRTSSWGYPMRKNPAIRDAKKGGFDVDFTLTHGRQSGNWGLYMMASTGAVIQDYNPKGKTKGEVLFNPPETDLGNNPYLCVRGAESQIDKKTHRIRIELIDPSIPLGSHIKFVAEIAKRVKPEKCEKCNGRKCLQGGRRKIVDLEALVVPPK